MSVFVYMKNPLPRVATGQGLTPSDCCCNKRQRISITKGAPAVIKLVNKEAPIMGDSVLDWSNVSTEDVEDFVLESDKLPLLLALSNYGTPTLERDGYLLTILGNVHFNVWVNINTFHVIIGFRGTKPGGEGFKQDLLDDAAIAGFIGQSACDLTILKEADKAMINLLSRGFTNFTSVGHSLGGTAAFCLANKYSQISRAISFNGGAPPTNPVNFGPGSERAVFYHIVGDIISSHIGPLAAKVARVQKIQGEIKDTRTYKGKGIREGTIVTPQVDNINWLSTWYHDSRRLLKDGLKTRFVDAQYEQNALENYIEKGDFGSYLLGRTFGKEFDWVEKMKVVICSNPIPGAVVTKRCKDDTFGDVVGGFFGGALGAFIGFLVGGPAGAVAGATIGAGIGSGKSSATDAVAGGVAGKFGRVGKVAYGAYRGVKIASEAEKNAEKLFGDIFKRKRSEFEPKYKDIILPDMIKKAFALP